MATEVHRDCTWFLLCVLAVLQWACQSPSSSTDIELVTFPVVNGTEGPTTIRLTPAEQNAVVWVHSADRPEVALCTGVLVSETLVLTAQHCIENAAGLDLMVGFGPILAEPILRVDIHEVHHHPRLDVTALVLNPDEPIPRSEIRSLPINENPRLADWLGMRLQGSGYGETESGRALRRQFVSLPMTSVRLDEFLVDGNQERGLCFGDSGAPLIADLLGQGRVVLGLESWGSPTCRGIEHIVRLDRIQGWIHGIEMMDAAPSLDCGPGRSSFCYGSHLVACLDGHARSMDCALLDQRCGWDVDEGRLKCTDAASCEDAEASGRCLSSSTVLRCPLGVATIESCPDRTECQTIADEPRCVDSGEIGGWAPPADSGVSDDHRDADTPANNDAVLDASSMVNDEPMAEESPSSNHKSGCVQVGPYHEIPWMLCCLGLLGYARRFGRHCFPRDAGTL